MDYKTILHKGTEVHALADYLLSRRAWDSTVAYHSVYYRNEYNGTKIIPSMFSSLLVARTYILTTRNWNARESVREAS